MYVEIVDFGFSESQIMITPGTTLVWTNRDPVRRSVTSDSGDFNSGLINPDAIYALTFTTAGSFPFHCMPHPDMTATVVVRGDSDTTDQSVS